MRNVIVYDCETKHSAQDCLHCWQEENAHIPLPDGTLTCKGSINWSTIFTPIGWMNKPALGLSIGCYFDYDDEKIHWFDEHTLETTMLHWVKRQVVLVGFNSLAFDGPLLRAILRRRAETLPESEKFVLSALCDDFKALCTKGYDVLSEIWATDPQNKFAPGLNSLDAVSQANGLGAKLSHGAQAPRDWRNGKWATVLNYCQDDVYKTKALFELALHGEPIKRAGGRDVYLRVPEVEMPAVLEPGELLELRNVVKPWGQENQ